MIISIALHLISCDISIASETMRNLSIVLSKSYCYLGSNAPTRLTLICRLTTLKRKNIKKMALNTGESNSRIISWILRF